MKRKYVILMIGILYTLCVGTVSESGTAWLNGRKSSAGTIIELRSDYSIPHEKAETSKYYSTHDWITECALDLLFTMYPQHKFIQMLYLNTKNMKMYFLLGTEAPDSIKTTRWRDVPTSMRTITRQDIEKKIKFNLHQVTFDPITKKLEENTAYLAKGAKNCQQEAERMLGEGDCQAAAFYLGIMCHFIADAIYFPHLRDSTLTLTPAQSLIDSLRWRMHYLTSRKLSDWNYLNGEISENGPFFNHDDAKSQFGIYKPLYKDAWQATWWAAHHACFGEAVAGFNNLVSSQKPYRPDYEVEDAWWLGESTDPENYELPEAFDLDALKGDEIRYDYWDNIPSQSDEKYLTALQHHLNLGVYYCAGVMNHIKNSYTKCEAGIEQELTQTIERLAVEYAFLWMMAGLGNIALLVVMAQTAVTAGITGKLELLKALGIST